MWSGMKHVNRVRDSEMKREHPICVTLFKSLTFSESQLLCLWNRISLGLGCLIWLLWVQRKESSTRVLRTAKSYWLWIIITIYFTHRLPDIMTHNNYHATLHWPSPAQELASSVGSAESSGALLSTATLRWGCGTWREQPSGSVVQSYFTGPRAIWICFCPRTFTPSDPWRLTRSSASSVSPRLWHSHWRARQWNLLEKHHQPTLRPFLRPGSVGETWGSRVSNKCPR